MDAAALLGGAGIVPMIAGIPAEVLLMTFCDGAEVDVVASDEDGAALVTGIGLIGLIAWVGLR